MLYTDTMQTITGIHYHLQVGPEEVRMYDEPPLAGPYVDIIYRDIDEAHEAAMHVVEGLLPEFLDQEEQDEAKEFAEAVTTAVKLKDTDGEAYFIEELGFEITFGVCSGCVPKGMN
ncbi:MAG: hypothetical protein LC650_00380 [Actinobacteria bacterium]|nr:hypothetical protein [Actinomycetota bacterium]